MSEQNDSDFIPTKSSLLRRQGLSNFEVVVHEKYKKKKVENQVNDSLHPEKKIMTEIDMKKARFEVYKFSKSKLNFSNKQKSNMELAIQLGAIPPKRKGKNYKELKIERLKQKEMEKEDDYLKVIQRNATELKRKSNTKPKMSNFKKKCDGILEVYGKVSLLIFCSIVFLFY